MKLKGTVLLIMFALFLGVNIDAKKKKTKVEDTHIVGKVKGQTIDGAWWWTVVKEDGTQLKLEWWSLEKSGNKEEIKKLNNSKVVVKGDESGGFIKDIKSIEIYDPNKLVKEEAKTIEDGLSGIIKGRKVNDEFAWTLEGDDGKLYVFGWYGLEKAGCKKDMGKLTGKKVIVKGEKVDDKKGTLTINELQSIKKL